MSQVGNDRTAAISPPATPLASFVVDTGLWRIAQAGPEAFDAHLKRATLQPEPAAAETDFERDEPRPAESRRPEDSHPPERDPEEMTTADTGGVPPAGEETPSGQETSATAGQDDRDEATAKATESTDAKQPTTDAKADEAADAQPTSPKEAVANPDQLIKAAATDDKDHGPSAEPTGNETGHNQNIAAIEVEARQGNRQQSEAGSSSAVLEDGSVSDALSTNAEDPSDEDQDSERLRLADRSKPKTHHRSNQTTENPNTNPPGAADAKSPSQPLNGVAEADAGEAGEPEPETRSEPKHAIAGDSRRSSPQVAEAPGRVATQSADANRAEHQAVAAQTAAESGEARDPADPAVQAPKPVGAAGAELRGDVSSGRVPPGSRGAAGSGESASAGPTTGQVDRAQFVQRVSRAFQAMGDREGPVRLKLHPPELGSLRLDIQVRGGLLTARAEAETTAARSLLLDNLPLLRDRLAEQGIKVGQFDVDLGERTPGGTSEQTAHQAPFDQRPSGEQHPPSRSPQKMDPEDEATVAERPALPGEATQVNVLI